MRKTDKRVIFTIFFLFCAFVLVGQSLQVYDYFEDVSNTYAKIENYKARINIQVKNQKDMTGTIFVKGDRIRINFTTGEVICVANGNLVVYDPNQKIVLEQEMAKSEEENPKGLAMLKKYYKYSYYSSEGYKIVPLEAKSQEEVVKLKFDAKWGSLEFRNLVISFTSDNLIRRIEGNTFSGSRIVIDWTNIQTNVNIPENLFNYDIPGNAHSVKNFIYTPEK